MERIKNKFDFERNRARPGATWVSGFNNVGRNDYLRSVDVDGAEMWFNPASRYYASCEIKRGQAVSIAQLSDLTDEQKKNKYPYVKITDPDLDDMCLGVAMNYAREGQIVQIQRHGKFNYYTTSSPYYTDPVKDKDGLTMRDKEIFLNADGWLFEEVRGQRLFIKKLYGSTPNNDTSKSAANMEGDEFDTDHLDASLGADTEDWFTYDFIDSIYNTKNTIQIGYLTDAPTAYTTVKGFTQVKDAPIYLNEAGAEFTEEELIKLKIDPSTSKDYKRTQEVHYIDDTNPEAGYIPNAKHVYRLNEKWVTDDNGIKGEILHHADSTWLTEKNGKFIPFDDFIVTVELDVTGDTRGPIDNTQFILTLGESIYFNPMKQDVPLEDPHYNEGVYDELKVVAIAEGNATSPLFRIFTISNLETLNGQSFENSFVSIRKLDGDTYIIPVLSDFTLESLDGNLTDPGDEGYWKLSKSFKGLGAKIHLAPALKTVSRDTLALAMQKGLETIFVDDETGETGCEADLELLGDDGFEISTTKVGGYYDVYVSSDLTSFISISNVIHGQTANAGEAILADIRDHERLNIAGVVVSNQAGVHLKGETIRVMKMGRIVTLGNLKPGSKYYLGLNGRITTRKQYWYDHCVEVGTSDSKNYFLVDCSQPLHSYSGNFPLGYIKPSVKGFAEDGFLLADGVTVYSKERYSELYEALLNWFDAEELKPSKVTDATQMQSNLLKNYAAFEIMADEFERIQNEIDKLKIKNDEQDSLIDKEVSLLRAEMTQNLEEISEKIQTLSEDLGERISSLDEDLATKYKDLQNRISGAIQDLKDNDLTFLKGEVTKAQEDIENLQKDLKALDERETEDKEDIDGQISALSKTLTDEVKDIRKEMTNMDTELKNEIKTEINSLIKKINDLKTELSEESETADANLQNSIDAINEELKRLDEVKAEKTNLENAETQIESLKTSLNSLKESLENAIENLSNAVDENKDEISEDLSTLQDQITELSDLVDLLYIVDMFKVNGENFAESLNDTYKVNDKISLTKKFFEDLLGVTFSRGVLITNNETGETIEEGAEYSLEKVNNFTVKEKPEETPDDIDGDSGEDFNGDDSVDDEIGGDDTENTEDPDPDHL